MNNGQRVRVKWGVAKGRTGTIVDYLMTDVCAEYCIHFDDTKKDTWGGHVSSQLERI